MGFLAIADRIFPLCYVDGLVRHHLDVFAVQDAFGLLCDHVGDSCFFRVEIIAQLLHRISLAGFLHGRHACNHAGSILCASCEDSLGLHVVFHIVGGKLHVPVGDGDIPIIVYHSFPVGEILHDGVPCSRESRHVQ